MPTWTAAISSIDDDRYYCDVVGTEGTGSLSPFRVYKELHGSLVNLTPAKTDSPRSQFNIITNGTMLMKGKLTYRDLFENGLNVAYVDMYAPVEKHRALAEASGYRWTELVHSPATMPPGSPSPWTYHGPEMKLIALALPPEYWPESAKTRHRLNTWMGRLDWKEASKHGLTPLREPMQRRCNQPFRHVSDQVGALYPVAGGDPALITGLAMEDDVLGWTEDGRALFVAEKGFDIPVRVVRFDLRTRARRPLLELNPPRPEGVTSLYNATITPDGRFYAYSYERTLSDLYVVDGLSSPAVSVPTARR